MSEVNSIYPWVRRLILSGFSIFDVFERSCQGGLLPLSHLSCPDRSLLVTCHLYLLTFLQRLYLCHTCQNWFGPQGCMESGVVFMCCAVLISSACTDLLEHLEICPSMYSLCVRPRASMCSDNRIQTSHQLHIYILYIFFTYSNQSLMHTSHLQLKFELSFQVRFLANVFLCFT